MIFQPHNKHRLFTRAFSQAATAPPSMAPPDVKGGDSNVFKGQHVRYVPKKRLNFDYASPEGPLALIYHASDAYYKRANNWKLTLGSGVPAFAACYFAFGPAFLWAYPVVFLPAVFNLYDLMKLHFIVYKTEVFKMWLYQNGD
jgi:hypothetical protein